MPPRLTAGLRPAIAALTLALLAACGGTTGTDTKVGPPARIEAVGGNGQSGVVGTLLPLPLSVKVTDATGAAIAGVTVHFSVGSGSATVSPSSSVTDQVGVATTQLTLGTVAGTTDVSATVSGLSSIATFSELAKAGPALRAVVTPHTLRLSVGQESATLAAFALDQFGNQVAGTATYVSRDPTLVTVDAGGILHVLRRPGSTYVVATVGGKVDSLFVAVLDASSTACSFAASPVVLAVGASATDVSASGYCARNSTAADAEYVAIGFYNNTDAAATSSIEVTGYGLGSPPALAVAQQSVNQGSQSPTQRDGDWELALRAREWAEVTPERVSNAQRWMVQRANGALRAVAVPNVGDVLTLNTNANDFCSNAKNAQARVVAVSQKAIIVADVNNPTGGFADADYQSFATTVDTLVYPVDVDNFGAPSDLDANGGRVIIFFTKAVNELTAQGSPTGTVLGFYYLRDLLPKTGSPLGSCPASNVAEMFYLIVPDPNGTINGNVRSNGFVQSTTISTIAHEFQHLINASRRLYVSKVADIDEETWLGEGLSHIAEELLYYKVAAVSPRQNLDGNFALSTQARRAQLTTYMNGNLGRYRQYLINHEAQGPIGTSDDDDDLSTRGAIWSYLRYSADRLRATDGDLWFKLVNGPQIGIANLQAQFGTDPMLLMHDWAASVYTDDNPPSVDARYRQPSWNFRSVMPALGITFPLFTRTLNDGFSTLATLNGGSAAYFRFTIPANKEALLTFTQANQVPTGAMTLTIVRVR
ncbi:MAG: hypothetical protein JWO05_3309 [Gemmatimonadetes bacterium]|nr:hypothetical protein [Gemmatimonadota bacterium]